jgi:hypothetical protein
LNQLAQGGIKPEPQLDHVLDRRQAGLRLTWLI